MTLLSRDEFRNQVLERDVSLCVICKAPATSVHHIVERKLWTDGGYYLSNGASLCDNCHIMAEQTDLSCEEIRSAAKIETVHLPFHLYEEYNYDKWGNILLPSGVRVKGELFNEEQVQKSLRKYLHLFSPYIKHPRTNHFPWSENLQNDDRMLQSLDGFLGQEVVATVKMDGEQCSLYNDYMHVRSLEYEHHESRSIVKQIHGKMGFDIPKGWRICGENMFAKHSIKYDNLKSYLYIHSIWNDKNECVSWDEMIEWCKLLDLTPVPLIYRGMWEESVIKSLFSYIYNGDSMEGYVVRVARQFGYSEYPSCVGKFVRKNHVQSSEHWLRQKIEINNLKQ